MKIALDALVRAELVDDWPVGREPRSITVPEGYSFADLRDLIERENRWVYADRRFHLVIGPQTKDELRFFRFQRYQVPVRIRFVRVAGGIGLEDIEAGTTLYQYVGLFPDGQDVKFSSSQERGFTEGAQGLASGEPSAVVNTTRKTISSGIEIDAWCALQPGSWARIVGNLTLSSFTGRDLDRNITSVPLDVDVIRGKWQTVHVFSALDFAASLQWGDFPVARFGTDWVRVDVCVD